MEDRIERAVAIVGVGAILPDAPSAPAFWQNIRQKRYSIVEVPPDRWRIADYYDPDPSAPDKTYSKIGGWVQGFEFDWKRFRIPPKAAAAMDQGQQWAVTIAAEALADYGFPDRPLDTERTGVILGTAMGGEQHYLTNLRIAFPEYARALSGVSEFAQLPPAVRAAILDRWHDAWSQSMPPITEDTMPGELPNIVSGRVANVLNLRGPNFITDAACASSFAAINAAVEMLTEHHVDAVIAGGVDRNMGASTFVKFCKIGALSATGSRPFGEGADGFVMGEGCASFLLKRLADAERNGDRIYAVIRGVGASSDGKGKGITAPNPAGQVLSVRRAWENAGLDPATATLIEAHGTSTRVGDVAELETLASVFDGAPRNGVAIGSAKSNIGHLKAGAGAAGLLKATLALHHKLLPPTLNAERPNPHFDFAPSPFRISHELHEWTPRAGIPRRAGVSAYGFGGTNFHLVLEEHVPGLTERALRTVHAGVDAGNGSRPGGAPVNSQPAGKAPVRGILALGADAPALLADQVAQGLGRVEGGWRPPRQAPAPAVLACRDRLLIDFGDRDELLDRLAKAQKAMGFDNPQAWKALQGQGIFRGSGPQPGKLGFLFPGQGSQYVNMGRELAAVEPAVAQVFAEADRVMAPILGRPLTDYIFVDAGDERAVQQAEQALMQTAITQPAVLTMDTAIYQLLGEYGFHPDMVMGHSLGEYGALIAADVMPFAHALEASAARGAEMTRFSEGDNGWMAAVFAPLDVVERILATVDGYVVAANVNSYSQAVIGGESQAVARAIDVFNQQGFRAQRIPVSHAFHTRIVAPASAPLRKVLDRLTVRPPKLPLVANVTGGSYPTTVDGIKDILEQQIASPVQWVKGLETMYGQGVRTFVEVGPKRALKGFVDDVLGAKEDVWSLLSCHPKGGELPTFNQALCGLYAAGYGVPAVRPVTVQPPDGAQPAPAWPAVAAEPVTGPPASPVAASSPAAADELGQLFVQALQRWAGAIPHAAPVTLAPYDRNSEPLGSVVISGTGLGLPGAEKPVMAPDNALRILRGEQLIDLIPERFRRQMVARRITRLVKDGNGNGSFETLTDPDEVVKLAGRPGPFDLTEEYGVPAKLVEALDTTTQLAMAAGLDALREAGIPLVQTYRRTSIGTFLPEKWMLPEALRDETGVIFASAFPGGDRYADEFSCYYEWEARRAQLELLEQLRQVSRDPATLQEIGWRMGEVQAALDTAPYEFDRRFIFRVLAMGHSQFAEYIGARGPNTHVNAACASTAQGIALAEDWIRNGRCRRVIVVGGDNVTSDRLMGWMGAGFLSMGAAATDDRVDEAALPFDRRRHGTILGMGACALVVESEDAVRERGMRGIAELLSSETANSAYHGTRLDVDHISLVMDRLITAAERRFGLHRYAMAGQTAFVSHETFTPARGGSASAEVLALRNTFGEAANAIVVANTKGFTGHPMGVGVEDVIAVKILEYGMVPPVPNIKEPDPDLGPLNLSRGGHYPVQFAIHLAAGFGSQIALTLLRRIPGNLDRVDSRGRYQRWLADISGYDMAETEVVQRVLRIQSAGAPARPPMASAWQYGTGPTLRTAAPGDGALSAQRLASLPAPAIPARPSAPAPEVRPAPLPAPLPVDVRPPSNGQTAVIAPTAAPVPVAAPVPAAPPPPVVPAPAAPAAVPAPVAAPAEPVPALSADPVAARVLAVVAEKTGYPEDMLDPDLDLEADLGIDTVKQAETFAAIREVFGIPLQEGLSLRDYPTVGHVIGFVRQMRPDLAAPVAAPVATPAPQPVAQPAAAVSSPAADTVAARVLAVVAEKTGYPEDMLDPDLDLEADLGIDTVKQAETFAAIREAFGIPLQEGLSLRDYPTVGHVIGFVRQMRPDLVAQPAAAPVSTPAPQPVAQPAAAVSSPAADTVAARVLAVVAEKTGYPEDMLDPDLDLEADLGIDTVKQAETFAAIREAFVIPLQEGLSLRDYPTVGHVIGFVRQMRPDLAAPPAATAAPASMPAAQPAAPAPAADTVAARVLAVVAEKTGYPQDMLDLDLDLEADLGVDTVKQAETLAAIREAFAIPFQEGLNLRDYPTLGHVIGFVHQMRPDLVAQATAAAAAPVSPTAPAPDELAAPSVPSPATIGSLEEADRMPRRVPMPALRPAIDLCTATGVSLGEHSRVVVMLDRGGVGKKLVERLQKLGVTVLALEPGVATDALVQQLQTWLAGGPIQGVYWLPGLDVEPAIEEMELDEWRELNRQRVKALYAAMRALYDAAAGPGRFLIAATRLGGLHGYGSQGASAPLGGAVTGFTKAYAVEQGMRPEGKGVLVKAVDFEASRKLNEPADQLIAETLYDPGVVEAGHFDGQRYSVTLVERPARDGQPGMALGPESVFVVTGAAGGITSAIVTDLAVASQGVFYLLDLVPAPAHDDENVRLFRSDREALKRKLIDQARAKGERPTPATVDRQIMGVERSEAALRAVESVQAAGGTAFYHSLDLRDGEAIAQVLDDIRRRYGRIDVLLHAGGLLIDRTLPAKEPQQFDLVFDVKADGFFSLLKAAKGLPIGATVAFSSVAGRFGNNGQSDYSAANDLLCKITSSLRAWRPETRAIAIDWTAWGSIGMAARGSVPQIMEALGVDMLPPEAGVPTIRRELTYGGTRGELLVAGRLGAWLEERHPTGGVDLARLNARLAELQPRPLLIGEVKAVKLYGGLVAETTLDPAAQPFLYDHKVEPDLPWLPGVMGTEALAEAAWLLAPGYRVAAVERQANLGALKFHRSQPRTLRLTVNVTPGEDGELLAVALLQSIFPAPRPDLPPQIKDHFAATVRLVKEDQFPSHPVTQFAPPTALPISAAEVYRAFFHGPAYQVIEAAQVDGPRAVALMAAGLPPNTQPAGALELVAPRVLEHLVQTAALWSQKTTGAMALPAGFDRATFHRRPEEAGVRRLYAVVEALDGGAAYNARAVDAEGNVYVELDGYRTVGLPA